jgi:hypothetical protein
MYHRGNRNILKTLWGSSMPDRHCSLKTEIGFPLLHFILQELSYLSTGMTM